MGLFWQRIKISINLLDLNLLLFYLRTHIFRSHPHTNVSTEKDRITLQEEGRDNLIEFIEMVPDECLIDLSEKIYSPKS